LGKKAVEASINWDDIDPGLNRHPRFLVFERGYTVTLKELRRLIDRLDHAHDDKVVMFSTVDGDYDIDAHTPPVSTPAHVFLFTEPV